MIPELKGKGVFVFSDPGGAKPMLALAEQQRNCIGLSDRRQLFYDDFRVDVEIHDTRYEDLLERYKPDYIVTGTSYTSLIEREVHRLAAEKRIPCYAFVDHWTSMRGRFEHPDGSFIVPTQVWVLDERAKRLALEAGIADTQVVVTKNPYHIWLANWKPKTDRSSFLLDVGLQPTDAHVLVYAPDPLSNVDGKRIYGFDEIEVSHQLDTLLHSNPLKNWIVLLKSHPNQNNAALKQALSFNSMHWLSDSVDTNTVLYFADVVMGFFSNILIEASIFGKSVLRYLPKSVDNDPIEEVGIGVKTDRSQLHAHLESLSKSI